jgi:hypothetical protein
MPLSALKCLWSKGTGFQNDLEVGLICAVIYSVTSFFSYLKLLSYLVLVKLSYVNLFSSILLLIKS